MTTKHVVSDELVWQILDKQFCSYKRTGIDQDLCSHPLNVYQVCKRIFCPLANSRYATIVERKGRVYLLLKSPERAHLPRQLWERIPLSENYEEGLKQIDGMLQFWDRRVRRRCKIRFTKTRLYLRRMRRLRLSLRPGVTHFKKRQERRLDSREKRALSVAKVENQIQEELLSRLRSGVYGTLYGTSSSSMEQQRKRKLNTLEDEEDEDEEDEEEDEFFADYQEEEEEGTLADNQSMEQELDDIADIEDIIQEYEATSSAGSGSRSGPRRKKQRVMQQSQE
jgi:protein MAK16